MSKWPDKDDDKWPADMPQGYYLSSDEGISWIGLRAAVIGLCRRVDDLERELAKHKRDVADASMSAALRESERYRRW